MKGITSIIFCLFFATSSLKAQTPDTTFTVDPVNGYTLHDALRQAREWKRMKTSADGYQFYNRTLQQYPHVTIQLSPGRYELSEPLVLRPEDSNLTIEAPHGAEVVGSMKVRLDSRVSVNKLYGILSSGALEFNGNVPRFRDLWVNGKKAVLSRSANDFNDMPRILNYDKQRQILWLRGQDVSDTLLSSIHNDRDFFRGNHAELVLHQMWELSFLRIRDMWREGDSVAVTFLDPESRLQFQHPWPGPMYKSQHDSPYFIQNHPLLADMPGEWWYAPSAGIFYMARKGETVINTAADVPVMENLVRVEGTAERPVANVQFRGITFSYTTWKRPLTDGFVPLQAAMYMTEGYKLRPKIDRTDNHKLDNQGWLGRARAAVEVSYGSQVSFSHCSFTHLGGSGLDFIEGCKGGGADSCSFSDIGLNGLVCGSFSPAGLETHLPYQPGDLRVVCDSLSVNSCSFTDIGTDDWGAVAVAAGYVSRIHITRNDIHDVPYTGISLGWGWNRTDCCMHDNYVAFNRVRRFAQHMTDCAAIYTLGSQPGTVIEQNDIAECTPPAYVHDPEHWFWLYTDEGSSHITVRNNRVPGDRFLKNANGPGNLWENNGPEVRIKN